MKKLEAIIKPFKLEEVKQELAAIGVESVTLSEVKGYGHQTAHTELYRDSRFEVGFMPRTKIEAVVTDDMAEAALAAIIRAARTGRSGDGKVFVTPVEQAIRIRTEETGATAILGR